MTDFSRARLNMVNAQLLPNGISSGPLVAAYMAQPRELLVDEGRGVYAYLDADLPVPGSKHFLLDPLVEARMLQETLRDPAQAGLVLGAVNLNASAMLSRFVRAVTILEPDPAQAAVARARLSAQGIVNVTIIETGYREGYERTAPYDIIMIPGAVSAVPAILIDQLAVNGRLVCVLRESMRAQGRILIIRKLTDGSADTRIVADAATPWLSGFEPARSFVF